MARAACWALGWLLLSCRLPAAGTGGSGAGVRRERAGRVLRVGRCRDGARCAAARGLTGGVFVPQRRWR